MRGPEAAKFGGEILQAAGVRASDAISTFTVRDVASDASGHKVPQVYGRSRNRR